MNCRIFSRVLPLSLQTNTAILRGHVRTYVSLTYTLSKRNQLYQPSQQTTVYKNRFKSARSENSQNYPSCTSCQHFHANHSYPFKASEKMKAIGLVANWE